MGLLDNKVVIVTGGAHGIGRAYCQGIAQEGGAAIVADIDADAAAAVARVIVENGGKALGIGVDVKDFASCREMAQQTLDRFGNIDGLVNNAAIFMSVPVTHSGFQDIPEDEWDRVMTVNVKGLW